ncbi:hypothetical protein M378DRAFT_156393, partial [Amanita muscaria Koide BX008]
MWKYFHYRKYRALLFSSRLPSLKHSKAPIFTEQPLIAGESGKRWQAEYAECFEAVSKTNADWAELFTWSLLPFRVYHAHIDGHRERYLTGATYLSSRAFPSSLLAPTPSNAYSLPNNPEDTILLKVAGLNGQRWSVGREAQGVEGLWDGLLQSFAPESETTPGCEAQLDAA